MGTRIGQGNLKELMMTEKSVHGVKFYVWAIIDFVLAELLIAALANSVPAFGDVFKQYGGKLPWLTEIVCRLGYSFGPYGHGLAIAVGVLGGLFFFTPAIKEKVEFKFVIYLFFFLMILLIILLIGLFSPMFYLGGPAK
jgi:type II secretory pathway component PulF